MKDFSELRKELDEVLKKNDIIVDDISMSKNGKYNILTIVLDRVGGIDLDAIVFATNIINPIVDKYDICDDSYILDVISKERGEVNG